MIRIENTSDKIELRECDTCNDITEIWTKEDIECPALMITNYNTGISVTCEDDDLVFMTMSRTSNIPIYIIDKKFSKCRNNKSIKIDIINYSYKFCTIPKNTKIIELIRATRYYTDVKKYTNSILNIGNILVSSSLKNQSSEKFESFINPDGTENLVITLKQPISAAS